jgi:lincosamide nucleotidyltransferase A/C/D/E
VDGFTVTADQTPARLELGAPDGRILDLHPVSFAADGSGVQEGQDGASFFYAADGFTVGTIDGVSVPCLSVEQQRRFRVGYDPRPVDQHDLALLEAHRRGDLPREGESPRTALT